MDFTGWSGGTTAFPRSYTLPDGSVLTLTLTETTATPAMTAVATPSFVGAAIGTTTTTPQGSYLGIAGEPVLYDTANTANAATLNLTGITMTSPGGANLTASQGIVAADGEQTNDDIATRQAEQLTFTTNGPTWTQLQLVPPAGTGSVGNPIIVGVGTDSVNVQANPADQQNPVAAWMGLAIGATSVQALLTTDSMLGGSRQAVMFALNTAVVNLSKTIVARANAADQFTYQIANDAGATVATGTTSGANLSGTSIGLFAAAGHLLTLSEQMAAGSISTLSAYTTTYNCSVTNSTGTASPGVSGTGTSFTISAQPGDIFTCAFVNTPSNPVVDLATVKTFTAGPTPTGNPNQYTITYTLQTTNSGGEASGYDLTDTPEFGAGVTINSATCAASGSGTDATTCAALVSLTNGSATSIAVKANDSIGAGVTHTYTISATVTIAPGSVSSASSGSTCAATPPTVTAQVGFNNAATTTPASGSASVSNACAPLPTNVTLSKRASQTTVSAGNAVSYTLTATNTGGTATANNLTVQELVPAGVTINSATPGAGVTSVSCGTPIVGDGATVSTCSLALVAGGIAPSGGTATFTLTGTATIAGNVITNYASTNPADKNAVPLSPPGAACNTATTSCASAPITIVSVVVANPDSSTTAQNTPVTTAVTTNDTSTGAPLNPSSVTPTQPSHGTVVCNNPTPGSCLYTPATNYAGPDSYTYQVCDTTTPTPVCATTTVSLTVQPNVVTANPDTATTPPNTPVSTPVTGNDTVLPNGAPLNPASVTATAPPAHGTVTCAAGSCTYTPATNYSGPDQYSYQVCDTSIPTPVCATTTVTINVGTSTLVANPDTATTPFNTPVTTNVALNDTSTGAPLNPSSVSPFTQPAHGTVTCSAGGCTYTPTAGYSGTDSYTYQICDTATPTPNCAVSTVSVVVGPHASNDTNTVTPGSPTQGTVTGNDTYPPGSTFTLVTNPPHGSLTFHPDGSYTYTPNAGFTGTDTFTYAVCLASPNQALCSTATVSITVAGTPAVAVQTPVNTPWLLWLMMLALGAVGLAQRPSGRAKP